MGELAVEVRNAADEKRRKHLSTDHRFDTRGTPRRVHSSVVPRSAHDQETIVAYNPQFSAYISLKFNASRDRFSLSGTEGQILSEGELTALHQEYKDNVNLEDEYGNLADERDLQGSEREDFFEQIRDDIEWPYPAEINYAVSSFNINGVTYYATVQAAGQLLDELKASVNDLVIAREDVMFLIRIWEDFHLKPMEDVRPGDIMKLTRILDGRNQGAIRIIVEYQNARRGRDRMREAAEKHEKFDPYEPVPRVEPRPSDAFLAQRAKVRRKGGQARLYGFRHVPVRKHLRRVGK